MSTLDRLILERIAAGPCTFQALAKHAAIRMVDAVRVVHRLTDAGLIDSRDRSLTPAGRKALEAAHVA